MSTFVYTRDFNEISKSYYNKCRHLFIQETLMKG